MEGHLKFIYTRSHCICIMYIGSVKVWGKINAQITEILNIFPSPGCSRGCSLRYNYVIRRGGGHFQVSYSVFPGNFRLLLLEMFIF